MEEENQEDGLDTQLESAHAPVVLAGSVGDSHWQARENPVQDEHEFEMFEQPEVLGQKEYNAWSGALQPVCQLCALTHTPAASYGAGGWHQLHAIPCASVHVEHDV